MEDGGGGHIRGDVVGEVGRVRRGLGGDVVEDGVEFGGEELELEGEGGGVVVGGVFEVFDCELGGEVEKGEGLGEGGEGVVFGWGEFVGTEEELVH